MYILCDTCSVLMLIRIAPDMFRDDRYGCVTIQEVFQELFRTQKFKTKYPWRTKYKSKIKAVIKSKVETDDFNLYLEAIRNIIETGKINERTKKFFSLSYVDQQIAACSIAHGFKLTTVDDDLNDFVIQMRYRPKCSIWLWISSWFFPARRLISQDPTLSQSACIQRLQIHQNVPCRILFFFFRLFSIPDLQTWFQPRNRLFSRFSLSKPSRDYNFL